MKKGIRGHDVDAIGLENIVHRCKEQGIEYLQLILKKSVDGFRYGQYSEEYAKNIGADYYSKDAKSAVEIAKNHFNWRK